ncbi:hypothetical protein ACG98H_04490 [Corynebacterium sp. L4756]|uniref:hypothetical protein n=1 Tax=unclassified Corynebacterium TaxID=2624378 RepID=UPI00374D4B0F
MFTIDFQLFPDRQSIACMSWKFLQLLVDKEAKLQDSILAQFMPVLSQNDYIKVAAGDHLPYSEGNRNTPLAI